MAIPFEPRIGSWTLNIHLILEYVAFFVAFRYYVYLKRQYHDPVASTNRIPIILGAAIGAFIGSRVIGWLENPVNISSTHWLTLFNVKTIMGGLFGGLIGVEVAKKSIGETNSSGDLFTPPLIAGIFIGRIGCFLSGVNEFTYGSETTFFTGMDLGDGILRHPIALYELIFLSILFIILRNLFVNQTLPNGMIFKIFMISYFGFRFFIEFIKPNTFYIVGLSTIQWLCITCFLYYSKTLTKLKHAYA